MLVEEKKSWKEIYGIGSKPKQTNYRPAVVLPESVRCLIPEDDTDMKELRLLEQKDREFCRQLETDKEFHDVFWYRMFRSRSWTPQPHEAVMRSNIDEAINNRIELVMKQKLLLAKVFELLDDKKSEQEHLKSLVDDEIIYMRPWMKLDMPNRSKILAESLKVLGMDLYAEK